MTNGTSGADDMLSDAVSVLPGAGQAYCLFQEFMVSPALVGYFLCSTAVGFSH